MDLTSTPFISYSEINVEDTDLYEDAWGFNSEFQDVLKLLGVIDSEPGDHMAERLIADLHRHS
jgi:hypothetical protein